MIASRALVLAVGLLLSGCASLQSPPKDTFYRLEIPASSRIELHGVEGQLLFVPIFEASGLHGERALVFAHGDGTALEQHSYHFWIDSPRQLLQNQLATYLHARLARETVTEPARSVTHVIQGRLRRFERRQGGGNDVASCEIEFRVYRQRSEAPLLKQTYRNEVDISGGPENIAAGLSQATATIFASFTEDLAQTLQ